MSVCRRTAGILDAWLEAGQLADRDARHVAGCLRCTDALARVDAFDADVRTAVRSLVLQAEAAGVGPVAQPWHPPRSATPRVRFGAGLASLAAVVVLVVVAGIRLTAPAAPAEPLVPVPLGPAEQALHQSGLRCTEVATGLECVRRLADGWQQVATLDVSGGAVSGLEVRLEPGSGGPFPAADVAAALAEPATDVLGIDVAEAVDEAVACGCARPIEGGAIHVEGSPDTGYLLTIEAR